MAKKMKQPFWLRRILMLLAILGPGLITASADNDAPGIATYSMVGSTYGYSFLWLIVAITVGEVLIQEIAARMGVVTGKGTADLIRERFGVKVTTFAMLCLLVANLGTTVAQFAGIAAATELFGISRYITVPAASGLMMLLILRSSYKNVEKVLIALCLASLSYVITVFLIKPDWGAIARASVVPSFETNPDFILAMLATIGTTIAPWAIFYMQSSIADKGVSLKEYGMAKVDVVFGAAWGNVISAFILICTAATLYVAGVQVQSAEQAAMALEPLAGESARLLFSIGLLGASLLAVLVLPLSTTYALCEAFGFERGLNRSAKEAPVFYGVFLGVMGISVGFVLIPGMPLFQIMWLSQALNAILLPVLLILVLKLVNDRSLMGKWVNKRYQNILAGGMTGLISLVTVLLLVSVFKG